MIEEPLARDTPLDVERRQIERCRKMSDEERGAMITGLTQAAVAMSAAGVRARHPGASPRELHLRLAIVMLGRELARRVYPEIDQLNPA